MKNEGGVFIGGSLIAGGGIIDGDSVVINGEEVGSGQEIDLSKSPDFIELDMRVGSIEQNGGVYVLDGMSKDGTKYRMRRLSGGELTAYQEEQAAKKERKAEKAREKNRARSSSESQLPTWESIKNRFPEGSITDQDYVGGNLRIGGCVYKMAQPPTKTTSGYVYEKIS